MRLNRSSAQAASAPPLHVRRRLTASNPKPVKIVVAGGFGVGKTTLVTSISEIAPLTTEAAITGLSSGVDDRTSVEGKTATTVALDFGRVTLSDQLVLYLFGTPGQDRFWFMWDELARGAIGAVVLVDTRRLHLSFAAIDWFERSGLPFVVAVNRFDGVLTHDLDEVRHAAGLATGVPLVAVDARRREYVKAVLAQVVRAALGQATIEKGDP